MTPHVNLAPYTTLGIGGVVDWFVVAQTGEQLEQACAFARRHALPILVVGEGSNMVVAEGRLEYVAIKLELPGFEVIHQAGASTSIRVGAGEHWDSVVQRTIELGLSGLEAMSMIPGTAGAAPVQNAGAYGQETADRLVELEAFDTREQKFVTIPRAACGFGYRTSRFREADAGRFIIASATFALSNRLPAAPTYASLKRYLEQHEIENPDAGEIREAVMAIRARILPDPSVVPNAGSFFKNPIVNAQKLHELQQDFEKVPSYAHGEMFKISAGWLLDECGMKGSEHFGLKIWDHHALVITNPHHASYAQLMRMADHMQTAVQKRFGISLIQEPLLIQ